VADRFEYGVVSTAGADLADATGTGSGSTISMDSSVKRNGSYSLKTVKASGTRSAYEKYLTSTSAVTVRMAVRLNSRPASWHGRSGGDGIRPAPAARRAPRDAPTPTLHEVLAATLMTSRAAPADYLDQGTATALHQLTVQVTPGTQITVEAPTAVDEDLAAALADAFETIAVEYEDSELDRKPRLSELLATTCFVLGFQPGSYLNIPADWDVTEITAS
jgi:hypothetical protein